METLWLLRESGVAGRLSLADAIAEARHLKLIGADHHELDALLAEGRVDVEWVR